MEADEKDLQLRIVNYMSRWFYTDMEVKSTDGKSRIDIVLVHKRDFEKKHPIGIEVKKNGKKTGSLLGRWLQQASRYSTQDFIGYGKLMVCTYPQVSEVVLSEGLTMDKHDVFVKGMLACQNNVNTFLAQFGVGELQKYKEGDREYGRIVFNAKLIWDMRGDKFRPENYELVCKR